MKLLLLFAATLVASAQVPATLPTYIGVGASFNQIGQPRWEAWLAGIYPASSSKGIYLGTVADIVPVLQFDPATQRNFYAFQTIFRQEAYKTVLTSGKFTGLVGGGLGAGFSQASPSGLNVTFAGSISVIGVYQMSKSFAVVMPIQALWLGSSRTWNALPKIGIMFTVGGK